MAQLPGDARVLQYTATALQTTFAYTFKIYTDEEIKVQQNDTTLDLTTHYTVTDAGETAGGTVVLVTGATEDDVITLTGDTLIERGTTFTDGGDFAADAINSEYDRLDYLVSEIMTQQGQGLQFDPIQPLFTATIPTPEANSCIKINAAGTAFEMSTYDPDEAQAACAADVVSTAADVVLTHADVISASGFSDDASDYSDDASDYADAAAASAAEIDADAFGQDFIPDADGTRDLGSAAKEWAEVHATDGFIYDDLSVGGDVGITGGLTVGGVAVTGGVQAASYSYTVAYNVDGGTYTTGTTLQTRPLNTEEYDTIGITLASNALTMPAGSYVYSFVMQVYDVGVGWGGIAVGGSLVSQGINLDPANRAVHAGTGAFTLASESSVTLVQMSNSARATTGMGAKTNTAALGDNVYANLTLIKVA